MSVLFRQGMRALIGGGKRRPKAMQFPLEDFLYSRRREAVLNTPECEYKVFGEPIHKSPQRLAELHKKVGTAEFLRLEARHAVGNFVMCIEERGKTLIITSPSYSGGYLHAGSDDVVAGTLLAPVLGNMRRPIEVDEFGICFYLNYAPQSNFNQLPFTTQFKDVTRLAPGTILEISDNTVKRFESYLCLPDRLPSARTFNQAMNEVEASLKRYFKRTEKTKAVLLFSGGVDSLIIYLCLRNILGAENITLYTMEHSASNGPDRALPIAKALGAEVKVISDGIYEDGTVHEKISRMMEDDILSSRGPHLAFLNMDLEDTIIFHGQNFDALANVHMEVLQETQEAGYNSAAGQRVAKTDNRKKRQNLAFSKNLQLTDGYLTDEKYQILTVEYYSGLHKGALPDPDPGKMGVLRGMISRQYPNLLSSAKYPMDQITHLNDEIERLTGYIGEEMSDPRMSLDMIRYLTYTQLANKRTTTFPLAEGTRPLFLAMSGPITSYYLGRSRTLIDASQPKRDIYAYSRHHAGKPYRTLIKEGQEKLVSLEIDNGTQPRAGDRADDVIIHRGGASEYFPASAHVQKSKQDVENAFLKKHLVWIDPATARLPKFIAKGQVADHLGDIYKEIADACASGKATAYQRGIALYLVNLEKIIAKAEKLRSAAQSTAKC